MLIFQVGGAVRDCLLGINASDSDFVVVNATINEFVARFPDARLIGKNFPVFSVDGKEYAFARKERKISPGYKGFEIDSDPDITIEEDLSRRDITINAIAKNVETGEIIDPFNGIEDLKKKRIVHVSEAFSEDPLRAYRVARFASKLSDFSVDPSTIEKMSSLKKELPFLPAERVWMECFKALSCEMPSRFFRVLNDCGLLNIHFKEVYDLISVPAGPAQYHPGDKDSFDHTMIALDRAAGMSEEKADPLLNFAVLCHDLGKGLTEKELHPHHYGHDRAGESVVRNLCERIRVPGKFKEAAVLSSKYHMKLPRVLEMRAVKALKMIEDLEKFPSGGVIGFMRVLHADSGEYPESVAFFTDWIKPVFKIKLPKEWQNLGKSSKEKLLQLKIEKYKTLKRSYQDQNL